MKRKILAISGSTRKGSSNESILRAIAALHSHHLDLVIFNEIDKLPHFNPDLTDSDLPSVVKEFREQIRLADGVIICTPEYVFSLPGSLKNAIEWNVSTTLFSNKPVAIIVASASGEKAFESLALIMTTIEAILPDRSKLLIKGGRSKVGANGEIQNQETLDQINLLVQSLLESIKQVELAEEKGTPAQ
ncbi:MAG: NAD(P)H-dependent oxidoreductase [Ignavibacteriae bacterium]|nr:NAD(P)H-dependent oxidoreductase [Ignavibacteriota bacterium]MCB9216797.1 NAD(P)H-dependent oxidoreductase [Ignavibacteria bacterium]